MITTLVVRLREAHSICDDHNDVATASLIEAWIDETERRTWFLFEATPAPGFHRALTRHWGPWNSICTSPQYENHVSITNQWIHSS
jgi:hypothetical protein